MGIVCVRERALYLNPGEIGQVLPAGAVKACEANLLPRRCFVRALPRINAFHSITSNKQRTQSAGILRALRC
jgi:hypothetical protein